MKLSRKLSFYTIIILMLISSNSLAHPGEEGEDESCIEEHGITPVNISYEKNVNIKLDGNPNDPAWEKYKNETINVPLAADARETEFYLVYMNLTMVLDTKNIYILCEWNDTTTVEGEPQNYDGLFFCWNMSVPEFSAEFWDGMTTEDMGGGKVDSWTWWTLLLREQEEEYIKLEDGAQKEMLGKDMVFDERGWLARSIDEQDVRVAYTFKENKSYTIEMIRPLVTDDEYDVQFDKTGEYLFNMGVVDDGFHQDHAISWTYVLNIEELESPTSIPGFSLEFLLFIGTIASVVLILSERKYILQKRNGRT